MNNEDKDWANNNAATWAIVGCATFTIIIQTIAMGLNTIGYDDVVRAQAQKLVRDIEQTSPYKNNLSELSSTIAILEKRIITKEVNNELRLKKLEEYSHKSKSRK